jgi:hypothetical protein
VPFLVWDSPQGRNVRELNRALFVIGRDAGSDLVLDHPTVSRRHALLQIQDRVKITDLRSTTGTKINGAKIAPDVPCTLEPGDFIEIGKMVLSFHTTAPPLPSSSPSSPAPSPPGAPPLPFPRERRPRRAVSWKPLAITVAFLVVIVGAALLALEGRKGPPPEPPAQVVKEADATGVPAEPAVPEAQPMPVPKPEAKAPEEAKPATQEAPAAPERAADGELPPAADAPDLPDLLELDGKTHLAARVRSIGDDRIEAVGADGRLYSIAAKRVTKIEDRDDLKRRVGVEHRRLAPDDVKGRVALAGWCLDRRMREDARTLVREALSLAPEDAAARALDTRLREQE